MAEPYLLAAALSWGSSEWARRPFWRGRQIDHRRRLMLITPGKCPPSHQHYEKHNDRGSEQPRPRRHNGSDDRMTLCDLRPRRTRRSRSREQRDYEQQQPSRLYRLPRLRRPAAF